MKKIFPILLALCAIFYRQETLCAEHHNNNLQLALERRITSSDTVLSDAFANQKSNIQVSGSGTVIKLLADDNDGSRHQKFILSLSSGQTLLIAHNIDIAPKINSLNIGDIIEFYGVYEWNPKGGVVHWTHSDPNGSHIAGWLKHQGRKYQ